MATEGANPQQSTSQLTALPAIEDIPRAGDGLAAAAAPPAEPEPSEPESSEPSEPQP